MMSFSHVFLLGTSVLLATNCGKKNTPAEAPDKSDTDKVLSISEDSSPINQLAKKKIRAATADWCAAALSVGKSQSASHRDQFESICNVDGSATRVFADLLSKPYTGNGNPSPTALVPIVSRDGKVSYLFAVGIKTPIAARTEFDRVLVKQGDIENEKGLIRFQGANPIKVEITPAENDGSDKWARGWKIDETSVQRVVVVDVRTSYSFVADHYDLGSERFLYLSTLAESRDTMKDYQLIMAGLDFDGVGYIIMVGHITVSDHGYPGIAKNTLQAQVGKSIQFVYKNAAEAVKPK